MSSNENYRDHRGRSDGSRTDTPEGDSAQADGSDINRFLRTYRRPNNGLAITDFFNPEYAFAYTDRRQSNSTDNSIPSPLRSHFPSGYPLSHNAPTVTASWTTASTAMPTVFSKYGGGASSIDSYPPAQPLQPTFVQQFAPQLDYLDPVTSSPTQILASPQHNTPYLWCELAVVTRCQVRYRIDEEAAWIQHHVDHLRDCFPTQCGCWFCDHAKFPSPQYPLNPSDNFQLRMEHIHQHIFDDYLTLEDTRPDFLMMDHLLKIGILSRHERARMGRYNELDHNLRIPGTAEDWAPRSRAGPPARESVVVHDLQAEARQLQRGRSSGHGWGRH